MSRTEKVQPVFKDTAHAFSAVRGVIFSLNKAQWGCVMLPQMGQHQPQLPLSATFNFLAHLPPTDKNRTEHRRFCLCRTALNTKNKKKQSFRVSK